MSVDTSPPNQDAALRGKSDHGGGGGGSTTKKLRLLALPVVLPGSNIKAHNQIRSLKSNVLNRKGSGNGCARQRLAPNNLGGDGEIAPRDRVITRLKPS